MNEGKNVFRSYSKYYDLLYKDKDYNKEADYIFSLIKKFNPNTKNILELGCGTGKHADLLAKKGFVVHGIDISETMLQGAKRFKNQNLSFALGDVRNYRINQKFDTVISLFHVASYQTSNDDLQNFFTTAQTHLKEKGIFIFDAWYGPAVLSQKPEKRFKILEDENLRIERTAMPVIHHNENVVDVNYEIKIKNKSNDEESEINETHKMRYLFKPELELMLKISNFEILYSKEWLSEKDIDCETWGACFVVLKR